MEESLEMHGKFRIEALDAKTGQLLWAKDYKNLLTNQSQAVRSQMLRGVYTGGNNYLKINYFALGTGTTAPSVSQTQLANEQFRKQVTQRTASGYDVITTCSIGAGEANFHIYEIGVFCGDSATDTADTGLMLSRVLVDIDKNSNMILNIIRTDICLINQ